jgi:hypothetical protein
MRILHYNVYCGQGCKVDPREDKLAKFGQWLQSQDVDVVGLTECNNWDKLQFEEIAQSWNFPHMIFFAVKSGYHLAMLSKCPIERFGNRITVSALVSPGIRKPCKIFAPSFKNLNRGKHW